MACSCSEIFYRRNSMLGCPQCQKHEPRPLSPENSALSPDGRRVALDISDQRQITLISGSRASMAPATHLSSEVRMEEVRPQLKVTEPKCPRSPFLDSFRFADHTDIGHLERLGTFAQCRL